MSGTSLQQRGFDLFLKGMNLTHRLVLGVTRGRVLDRAFGMQSLELHTVGRKSGQRRSVMLTAPILEPDRVVLIASKGGDDRDPDWYRNLVANPEVSMTIRGVESRWTARTATPAEKSELWPTIVAAFRGYADYQRRTERDIPVVICTPRS